VSPFPAGEGSFAHSLSSRIEAERWDAVQACLDKRPTAKAPLDGTAGKARRSRGSGGGVTDHADSHDQAPAFVWFAWFVEKEFLLLSFRGTLRGRSSIDPSTTSAFGGLRSG
jgi:hypothetical protein